MITVKVIRWEMLVLSEQGPRHALTKLVLMKLAQYMKNSGKIFPSQERLAKELGLTEKTIRKHVDLAINGGWIMTEFHNVTSGQGWRRHEYILCWPKWFNVNEDEWLQDKEDEIGWSDE